MYHNWQLQHTTFMYIIINMHEVQKFYKSNKRFFDALRDMFVLFAIIHIAVTFILAIRHWDFSYINVFYIESISELIPGIEKGLQNQIISVVIIACVYYFFFRRRGK